MRYALDGVFSFSRLPLRLLTYAEFSSAPGSVLGLYYVVKRLIEIETAPTGFTTLAALVLFLGGVQLIAIGVLGEYLGRVYDEVKQRPVYLVNRRARPVTMRGTAPRLWPGAAKILYANSVGRSPIFTVNNWTCPPFGPSLFGSLLISAGIILQIFLLRHVG